MSSSRLAIVLLSPPESGYSLLFKKDIAGIPLFKRLLLTLQKSGISEFLVLSRQLDEREFEIYRNEIESDPRFKSVLNWHDRTHFFETKEFEQTEAPISSKPFLLVNGNLVIHQKVVQQFMDSTNHRNPDGIFCLALESGKPGGLYLLPPKKINTLNYGAGTSVEEDRAERVVLSADKNFWIEVRDPATALTAEEHLLKSVGLSNDSLMDRFVTRFISRQLTRLFLKTSLTPNQITFLSLLIGLGSAWYFFQGTYFSGILGSLLLLVSAWVDCTDGEIARLKFMATPWGARFDIFCDNIVHFFVFFSIGMGVFSATGNPVFKLYGGLAVFGSLAAFMILGGIIVKNKQAVGQGEPLESNLIDQVANRDFVYFLLIMAWIDKLDIFIFLTAIGANVFALYLMYQRSRWGKNSI